MTKAPKPPKRRRRRIVVAFVVLLLVSMLAFWFWPRGDVRFVGKWAVARSWEPTWSAIWTFDSNGLFTQQESRGLVVHSIWRFQNGKLVLGGNSDYVQSDRVNSPTGLLEATMGELLGPTDLGHEVLEVSFSVDHVVIPCESGRIILKRIHE
jgi:hypothetical protein